MGHKTIFKLPKVTWQRVSTPEDDAIEEAQLLDADILRRELDMIDAQHKINAQRAKKDFIVTWLMRDTPVPLKR